MFDRPKGKYKFREVMGRRVEQNTCLDDGHLQISEDQQQRVLDDTVNAAFQSRGQGLSQSDLPQQQQQSKDLQPDLQDMFKQFLTDRGFAEASSSGIKRERERGADDKDKKDAKDDDTNTSDDEVAPMDRIMQITTPKKPKAKTKSAPSPKATGESGDIAAAATTPGDSSTFTDRTVTQILGEVDQAFNAIKNTKQINDISAELLKSLASRLQNKKNQLCRKASKRGGDTVSMMDAVAKNKAKVTSAVELFGAITAFERKRTVKAAQTVDETFVEMKATGAFAFMPACVAARSLHADLHVKNSESKSEEALELCKVSTIGDRCPMATAAEAEVIQIDISSRLAAEEIRQNSEKKEAAPIAKAKVLAMLNNILPLVTDVDAEVEGKKVFKAIVVVFNDKAYTCQEALDALSIIEKLSKHNELCKVLLNLTPFDEIFLEVKNRIRESEKISAFIKSIEAVKDSNKAQQPKANSELGGHEPFATTDNTCKHNKGSSTALVSSVMALVEANGIAFKSMPEVDVSDLPSFELIFADMISSCKPLCDVVSQNMRLFESRLLEAMKNVGAESPPDQAELTELSQFLGSMTMCRTGLRLLTIVQQTSSMFMTVNCQANDELNAWAHIARKGKCMDSLVVAAGELQGYLKEGKLMVEDGARMERASALCTCACSTLLAFGHCAGEADAVILAVCFSFFSFLCRCVCFVLFRVVCLSSQCALLVVLFVLQNRSTWDFFRRTNCGSTSWRWRWSSPSRQNYTVRPSATSSSDRTRTPGLGLSLVC